MSTIVNIIQDLEPVTVNIDNQENIEVNVSVPVPEAPVDGLQYARQDASWVEVAAAGLTAASFGAFINGLDIKPTPVDVDELVIKDSEDSNNAKGLSWANLKATIIEDNSITNTKLAQIAQSIIKGRVSSGTGNVEDLTIADIRAMVIDGFTTTATAAGTTTLIVSSTAIQEFTGVTTQTIQMPVVSTLILGRTFKIINNSTGILTVNSSGSDLIATINPGITKYFVCVKVTGTDETSWAVNDFGASGGGISDTPQSWSSTIQFDGNYGSFNTNAHSQSSPITFTINWTGAVFGAMTSRIIESNVDTITIPDGVESIINNATGSFVGREFTPIDGNRYRFVFECTDVSNQKYNCLVIDSEAYVEPVQLNAPVLTSATAAGTSQIDLIFTSPNTSPAEVEKEIQYDVVDTFDSDPQTTTAVQGATTKSVTGLDPDTEYFFRVRDKGDGVTTLDSDWSNIESDTTGASSIIIVQDDFAGTVIDTGKWSETDPSDVAEISQNDQLIGTFTGTAPGRVNYVQSLYDNDGESVVAVQFTQSGIASDPTSGNWWGGLWFDNSSDDEIMILGSVADASLARLLIRLGGVTQYDFTSAVSVNNTFKILKDGNDISFYYWSGSAWVQIGSTQTVAFSSILKPFFALGYGYTSDTAYLDNFYFSNADYSSNVPS